MASSQPRGNQPGGKAGLWRGVPGFISLQCLPCQGRASLVVDLPVSEPMLALPISGPVFEVAGGLGLGVGHVLEGP